MSPRKQSLILLSIALCVTIGTTTTLAGKPGGGPGGSTSAYTIVDLRSPYHTADGNWSQTYAEKISHPNPATGVVFVSGSYVRSGQYYPCLWSVSPLQAVGVTDLAGTIEARDVNAAGIVGGVANNRPAVLIPGVGVVTLPTTNSDIGQVHGLNDPDSNGVFHVVGVQQPYTPPGVTYYGVLWTVRVDGTVLATQPLVDAQGVDFDVYDVNNAGVVAGLAFVNDRTEPLIAWFDENDVLQIEYLPNPNPAAIRYWYGIRLDDAGNVVGYGAEPTGTLGVYPRAVVWPVTGPTVSLSTLINGYSTMGEEVASVNGMMQVVGAGFSTGSGWYASLYTNGNYSDLNRISKGSLSWNLWRADGVNSIGWICGRGHVKVGKSSEDHAFVLVPNVP
jgi:hypothetical protein